MVRRAKASRLVCSNPASNFAHHVLHPGTCTFINDATDEELAECLRVHKALIKKEFPSLEGGVYVSSLCVRLQMLMTRFYSGKDAFVDASDLGMDPKELEKQNEGLKAAKGVNAAGIAGGVKDANQSVYTSSVSLHILTAFLGAMATLSKLANADAKWRRSYERNT